MPLFKNQGWTPFPTISASIQYCPEGPLQYIRNMKNKWDLRIERKEQNCIIILQLWLSTENQSVFIISTFLLPIYSAAHCNTPSSYAMLLELPASVVTSTRWPNCTIGLPCSGLFLPLWLILLSVLPSLLFSLFVF